MAAIVAEREQKFSVISVGLGTRCCGRTNCESHGKRVFDGHAETMCRRSFRSYLLSEISDDLSLLPKTQVNHRDKLISQPHFKLLNKSGDTYSMIPNTKLHFYVSHLPCGECTIIDFEDVTADGTTYTDTNRSGSKHILKHFEYSSSIANMESKDKIIIQSDCRMKPVRSDVDVKKRNLSLSCTDKISKWARCGFEGTLLSFFLPEGTSHALASINVGGPIFNESVIRKSLRLTNYPDIKIVHAEDPKNINNQDLYFRFENARNAFGKELISANISSSGLSVGWRRNVKSEIFDLPSNSRNLTTVDEFVPWSGWGESDVLAGASGLKFGLKESKALASTSGMTSRDHFLRMFLNLIQRRCPDTFQSIKQSMKRLTRPETADEKETCGRICVEDQISEEKEWIEQEEEEEDMEKSPKRRRVVLDFQEPEQVTWSYMDIKNFFTPYDCEIDSNQRRYYLCERCRWGLETGWLSKRLSSETWLKLCVGDETAAIEENKLLLKSILGDFQISFPV
eukprot:GDKJ01018593.1.p1 GENE.GDKJ01018593.1~~GDKJ01018593.1.p1  ORF type:complete len:511 (-),score=54.78 GDKJ01018593.1:20-1552(-)